MGTRTRRLGPLAALLLLPLWLVLSRGPTADAARLAAELASGWQSSIIVDGRLAVEQGEWRLASERLDVDPRPRLSQSLWASFDQTALYLGWRGARWGIDGTGYLYLDTGSGGTTTPWPGPDGVSSAVVAGKSLPFAADYVVFLQGVGGGVMRWDGAAWRPNDLGEAQAGPDGDTELRLPWASLGTSVNGVDLRLFAFDDDHGRVISIFPTNQSVLGPWTSAYRWTGLSPATVPNAGQPQGNHVTLALAPPRWASRLVGPGGATLWTLDIRNLDRVPVTGITLDLSASPGLTLESIEGAPGPSPAARWTIPLGDLAPGARAPITVTARVASAVAHVTAVTVTGQVRAAAPSGDVTLSQSQASVAVDNAPPTLRVDLPPGATMRSGQATVSGTAADLAGVGYVEVRVGDGPWRIPLTNLGGIFTRLAWSIGIDVPASGTFVVQARAHDVFGQVNEPVSASVTVDNTPPVASLHLPSPVVRASPLTVSGTVVDPFPLSGTIQRVEAQVDDGAWQVASPPYLLLPPIPPLPPLGARLWRTTWRVPTEQGVEHRIRARAVDAAGNVGAASEWTTFTVDSVPPTSTLAYPTAGSSVPDQCLTLAEGHVLMWGTATDGWKLAGVQVSVDGGQTWQNAQLGGDAAALLAHALCPPGGSAEAKGGATLWAVSLPAPAGELALRSRAVDAAGNVEALKTPARVRHVATPPARPYRLYLPTISQRAEPLSGPR